MTPKHHEWRLPVCVMLSSLLSRRFTKTRRKKNRSRNTTRRSAASLANLAWNGATLASVSVTAKQAEVQYIQIAKRLFPISNNLAALTRYKSKLSVLLHASCALFILLAFNVLPVTAAAEKNDIGVM